MTTRGKLIASSLAGLFAAVPSVVLAKGAGKNQVICDGINACKGQGTCSGPGHACGGQNACKGQGHSKVSKEECLKKGGKIVEPKM